METESTLAKNIKAIQKALKMNCKEFAKYLEIGTTTLNKLRTGKTDFSYSTLEQVARKLNTTTAALLSDPEAPTHSLVSALQTVEALSKLTQQTRDKAMHHIKELADCLAN